jgi:hypothetical protein
MCLGMTRLVLLAWLCRFAGSAGGLLFRAGWCGWPLVVTKAWLGRTLVSTGAGISAGRPRRDRGLLGGLVARERAGGPGARLGAGPGGEGGSDDGRAG